MCITFISNAIGRRFRRLWTITAEDDADIHTAGPSNTKSLDYDCDDDDNITSSKLEDAINALSTKFLSNETLQAVHNIRSIVTNLSDFGVVDIFAKYPIKDIAASILALARLQHVESSTVVVATTNDGESIDASRKSAANNYSDTTTRTKQGSSSSTTMIRMNNSIIGNEVEEELLHNLAHYAIFARAAYGWDLKLLSGKLHFSSLTVLTRETGIPQKHVLSTNWSAKTHLPAYFIVRDVERQKIILSIRGTLSVRDVLTDLCCTSEEFPTHDDAEMPRKNDDTINFPSSSSTDSQKYNARAHVGMVAAARGVAKNAREIIATELASNPHYKLLIVGHSLGGGTAAVLGTMWQNTFPGVVVYAYGSPCVGPLDAQPTINKSIISVVGEGDPFSCLSIGHVADISSVLSELCEDHSLRNEILGRTRSDVVNMSDEDVNWSIDKMKVLRRGVDIRMHEAGSAEKFYPPGRILYMEGNLFSNSENITLREVTQSKFQSLRLHHRMLDFSQHIPHRYEGVLSRISSTLHRSKNK